mmetsp:Transcript_12158/g.18330  ORF Transcript_12158/g.18330 Transcript_12158/m.18330 type:complete len:330 (+) Transcript_12158:40-1029(+)
MASYDESIIEQLITFGYRTEEIKHAMDNVEQNKDINAIMEYCNNAKAIDIDYSAFNSKVDLRRYSLLTEQQRFLVDGFIRMNIESILPQQITFYIIPISINMTIACFSSIDVKPVPFNPEFYADSKLELYEDNHLVRHEKMSGYACISALIEPIESGVHCFRVLANSSSRNTTFFCFMRYGAKNEYKYESFYDAAVYGTTTHGYTVYNGQNDANGLSNPAAEYQLDMLINCEQREIRIGFVKDYWKNVPKRQSGWSENYEERRRKLEIVHSNIPANWAWVPHFNLYDGNSYIRVLSIQPYLYRQTLEYAETLLKVGCDDSHGSGTGKSV